MRASSLPLLTKCPGSATLPTLETKSEQAEIGADWGTMVHRWKETGEIRHPKADKRSEGALKTAIERAKADRHVLWPHPGKHETALAIRIDGTREVRDSHEGVFGLDEWITGTADFSWYMFEDELWVDDLKTGKYYPDENGTNRFPQDPRSGQLKAYALGIALLLKYTGVVHVSITHWPRLPVEFRNAPPARLWTTLTWEELEEYYAELEQLYRNVNSARHGGIPVLSPGDHCRFCPSKSFCLVAQPDVQPQNNWRY